MHSKIRATVAAAAAVGVLLLTACDPATGGQQLPTKKGHAGGHHLCDRAGGAPKGLRGEVVSSDRGRFGRTCLLIAPNGKGKRVKLVRVPKRVYNRCQDGEKYPACRR